MNELTFGDIKKMDYNDNLPFKFVLVELLYKKMIDVNFVLSCYDNAINKERHLNIMRFNEACTNLTQILSGNFNGKEKHKAYDDALEKAKACHKRLVDEYNQECASEIEKIFPELKENENKQSKKWILEYLYDGLRKSDEQFKSQFKAAIAWLEKQDKQEKQVHFPKFTFDDVLALQCCMETVKKVQEDKELYEQLNLIHSKMYDAYWIEKECKQTNECAENKQKCADKIEPRFKV